MFSDYFSSFYSTDCPDIDSSKLGVSTFDLPNNVYFSVDDVFHSLSDLHGIWTVGPDELAGNFLFELRSILAYPLWILFRRLLDDCIFASMFKFSSVTPVPKSGSPSVVSNYQPISIQSHVSKIIESLVLNGWIPSVNNILMEEQHGFRPSRSTSTSNLLFCNYIFDSFIQYRSQVDVIFTDFKKSFRFSKSYSSH